MELSEAVLGFLLAGPEWVLGTRNCLLSLENHSDDKSERKKASTLQSINVSLLLPLKMPNRTHELFAGIGGEAQHAVKLCPSDTSKRGKLGGLKHEFYNRNVDIFVVHLEPSGQGIRKNFNNSINLSQQILYRCFAGTRSSPGPICVGVRARRSRPGPGGRCSGSPRIRPEGPGPGRGSGAPRGRIPGTDHSRRSCSRGSRFARTASESERPVLSPIRAEMQAMSYWA